MLPRSLFRGSVITKYFVMQNVPQYDRWEKSSRQQTSPEASNPVRPHNIAKGSEAIPGSWLFVSLTQA